MSWVIKRKKSLLLRAIKIQQAEGPFREKKKKNQPESVHLYTLRLLNINK